jgi:hypothetical protein
MLCGFLMAAFLTLVACVWQDWNRTDPAVNVVSLGAGGFMICFLAPGAAVVAVLMLRAWTWSAYDANPLVESSAAEPVEVCAG